MFPCYYFEVLLVLLASQQHCTGYHCLDSVRHYFFISWIMHYSSIFFELMSRSFRQTHSLESLAHCHRLHLHYRQSLHHHRTHHQHNRLHHLPKMVVVGSYCLFLKLAGWHILYFLVLTILPNYYYFLRCFELLLKLKHCQFFRNHLYHSFPCLTFFFGIPLGPFYSQQSSCWVLMIMVEVPTPLYPHHYYQSSAVSDFCVRGYFLSKLFSILKGILYSPINLDGLSCHRNHCSFQILQLHYFLLDYFFSYSFSCFQSKM